MERDTQRLKVYRVGWSLKKKALTLKECQELIQKLSLRYCIKAPALGDGRRRKNACGSAYKISLPKWARNDVDVAHEFAHTLQDHFSTGAYHSPQFARIFFDLLVYLKVAPRNELTTAFRREKVKLAPLACSIKPVDWKDKLHERVEILVAEYANRYNLDPKEVYKEI